MYVGLTKGSGHHLSMKSRRKLVKLQEVLYPDTEICSEYSGSGNRAQNIEDTDTGPGMFAITSVQLFKPRHTINVTKVKSWFLGRVSVKKTEIKAMFISK
jgi:hypothetical protein